MDHDLSHSCCLWSVPRDFQTEKVYISVCVSAALLFFLTNLTIGQKRRNLCLFFLSQGIWSLQMENYWTRQERINNNNSCGVLQFHHDYLYLYSFQYCTSESGSSLAYSTQEYTLKINICHYITCHLRDKAQDGICQPVNLRLHTTTFPCNDLFPKELFFWQEKECYETRSFSLCTAYS